jgi:hypothetical protein
MKVLRPRVPANDSVVLGVLGIQDCKVTMKGLESILKQTVDKNRVHVVLASTQEVPEFTTFQLLNQREYASVTIYVGDALHEYVLEQSKQHGSHMCITQANHLLEPQVIQTLLDSKEKGVIAPMLVSSTRYSNYHTKVDANGYCLDDPMYDELLYKRVKGQISVPVINGTYFVHHKFLSQISYKDGTPRESYVIMSNGLRNKGIPQYLDNRQYHGSIA